MTNLLAIDTATDACSVALLHAGEVTERYEVVPRRHNQRLQSMLQELLGQGDLRGLGIEAIAYGAGPGSFTGLRIAAAAVQGLAFSNSLPAVPVSTLAAQALTAARLGHVEMTQPVLSLIDARIGEVYWAVFEFVDGLPTMTQGPGVSRPAEIPDLAAGTPLAAVGDGCALVTDMPSGLQERIAIAAPELLPAARDILPLAQRGLDAGHAQRAQDVAPVYVRDEISWKKLAEQGKAK